MRCLIALLTLTLLTIPLTGELYAQAPTTRPATDDVIDFILNTDTLPATTQPTTRSTPTTSPLVNKAALNHTRSGTFTFSDGSTIAGTITTTLEKPIRVWEPVQKEFIDIPFQHINAVEAVILWERDQPEYQFLTSGSDIKTFTGKTYPARETAYTFKLKDGKTVTGSVVAPFDVRQADGSSKLIVLSKRDKGAVDQSLKELIYVMKVTFNQP